MEKKTYPLNDLTTPTETFTYTYATSGWRDQLTSFNGEECVYDRLGNPTTYRGKTLQWSYLRQLTKLGSTTFAYGANGIRYKKNNTTYLLDGDKILKETTGTKSIIYYHGMKGIVGFRYNGKDYFYRKNLQGDVTHIYDTNGTLKAKYVYDAWGNHKITTDIDGIGTLNPIRYRGYYYDTETGLYYLEARYYDPETGRFISQDEIDFIVPNHLTGLNLFAYCNNNPIMFVDYTGHSVTAILIGLGIATLVGGIIGGVVGYNSGDRSWELAKSITIGAGLGLAIGGAVVATTAVFAGAIAGATATVFGGVGVSQAFAIGALAFDAFAYFIAPLFGVEMDGIEYEPISNSAIPNNKLKFNLKLI